MKIIAARMQRLSRTKAEGFYAEHRGRPFFESLVTYMMSGPVVVQVLEGENAIAVNRKLMGATNPKDADPGTIRADFAESIDANAVHGSDSHRNPRRARSATSSTLTTSVREAESTVTAAAPAINLFGLDRAGVARVCSTRSANNAIAPRR